MKSAVRVNSLCNNIANASNAIFTLTYVGVQGLLVARAYSLCHEHKVVVGALAFLVLGGFILSLYAMVAFSGCLTSRPLNAEDDLLNIFTNIDTVLVDLLVFGICLRKVWDTWKLKRGTGIQSNNDLVSILIKQIISRFCFVVLISATSTILGLASTNVDTQIYLPPFQQALSAILVAEFTLDLRQRNSAAITSVVLPTIQMHSILQYVHESIIAGMGDHDHENARAGGDDITGIRSADYDIEPVQDESVSA